MRPSRPEGNRCATPGAVAGTRESGAVGRRAHGAACRTRSRGAAPAASARRGDRALKAEELALDCEPARIAADPPTGRDHPMARDDDRDRVVAERLPDRAAPMRLAD